MTDTCRNLIDLMTGNPDLYPGRLLIRQENIAVMQMSRGSYRDSPFLDQRMIRENDTVKMLPFALIAALKEDFPPVLSSHFIFHSAFACSTLLTRYLDALDGPLVLREPDILYEVITLRRFDGTSLLVPLENIAWDSLFRFVLGMLTRRYKQDIPTIIKPTDACNYMLAELLDAHPENRGVFIYSPLERFLASIMRHKVRHEWVRTRIRELLLDVYREKGEVPVRPESLTVGQAAALIWVLHAERYLRYSQQNKGSICVSLNADDLVTDPVQTVSAICRHFDLDYDAETIDSSFKDARLDMHSKAADVQYGPDRRDYEYQAALSKYSGEIDAAMTWIRGFCSMFDPAGPLPDSLSEKIPVGH